VMNSLSIINKLKEKQLFTRRQNLKYLSQIALAMLFYRLFILLEQHTAQ